MKNKLAVLALLSILPFFLAACTMQDLPLIGKFFGPKVNTDPVTLNVWGLWEKPEVMDTLVKRYQEQHPNVSVNYEDRSILNLVDYKETIFTRASQQSGGADIVLVHASWLPRLQSLLTPMPTSLMNTETYNTNFYPVAAEMGVASNQIYGIPAQYDGLVLVYNKDHFKEIDQTEPPTAWEEFRRLALQLSVRTGEGRTQTLIRAGAAVGTANNNDHFSDILGLMWSQAGISIPNNLDSKSAYDALTFYTNFVKEDGVWNNDMPEAVTAFAQGKVSMIFVPSWRILDILAANPQINLGVAPVPQAIPSQPASWASFWMYSVPSTSTNSATAWDFINFLSSEEAQLMLFSESAKMRPFGAPYSLKSLSAQLTSNPYLKPVVDIAPYAKTAEIAGRSGNRRQVEALQEAVNAVLSGTSAEQALNKAKEELSK